MFARWYDDQDIDNYIKDPNKANLMKQYHIHNQEGSYPCTECYRCQVS